MSSVIGSALLSLDVVSTISQSSVFKAILSAIETIKNVGEQLTVPSATLELREVQNRSGALWECIGRKSDPDSGGYSYDFLIRPEFNDLLPLKEKNGFDNRELAPSEIAVHEKNKELYPAIEKYAREMVYLDSDHPENVEIWRRGEYAKAALETDRKISRLLARVPTLRQLGYSCESRDDGGVYLKLPDLIMLHSRWNKLRQQRPELPELNLISSRGVASPLDFVNAYLTSTGVLSSGKEFVHDHQFHVIPTIRMMLDTESYIKKKKMTYKDYKQQVVATIKPVCETLIAQKKKIEGQIKRNYSEDLKKKLDQYHVLEIALSAVVDELYASDNYESALRKLDGPLSDTIRIFLNRADWKEYFISKGDCTKEAIDNVIKFLSVENKSDASQLFIL